MYMAPDRIRTQLFLFYLSILRTKVDNNDLCKSFYFIFFRFLVAWLLGTGSKPWKQVSKQALRV